MLPPKPYHLTIPPADQPLEPIARLERFWDAQMSIGGEVYEGYNKQHYGQHRSEKQEDV